MVVPADANVERLWAQLLQFVENGQVVPVIGQDLLKVRVDEREVPLYALLAERLAAYLEVPNEGAADGDTLNSVACRHLKRGGDMEDIYPALMTILSNLRGLSPPTSLSKLADIGPFRLFVSTTFDPFLEVALNQVRFGGECKTGVRAYSPERFEDYQPDGQSSTVFHLLGRVSASPEYAVTEEDTLEFFHSLHSDHKAPQLLFDELRRKHLLIVGCSFAGWLARFFIRMGKPERLSRSWRKTDYVADQRIQEDAGLVLFLQRFSSRTKLFPGTAVEFVDELHRRWTERRPSSAPVVPSTSTNMEPGSVFLSYAHEDAEAVQRIKMALERAGIDVWLDREQLRGGDAYERKIKSNIESCSLFLPVISRHSLTPQKRFFRIEWTHAEDVARLVPESLEFIVPVVIDDTPLDASALPASFRSLHATRLPGGQVTPAFLETIRDYFRDFQKAQLTARN